MLKQWQSIRKCRTKYREKEKRNAGKRKINKNEKKKLTTRKKIFAKHRKELFHFFFFFLMRNISVSNSIA